MPDNAKTPATNTILNPAGWPQPKGYANGVKARGEMVSVKRAGVETGEACPTCGKPMKLRFGRFGEVEADADGPLLPRGQHSHHQPVQIARVAGPQRIFRRT